MKLLKRLLITTIAICTLSSVFATGQNEEAAEDYPKNAIQIVVPANPGGDTDMTARFIAKEMEKTLGVSMPIVNMAGSAGTLAANDVLNSAADGYKVMYFHTDAIVSNLLGVNPHKWDTSFEIAGIPSYVENFAMFTSADAPYSTLDELIAYAKDPKNKKLIYSTDIGSINQVLGRVIQKKAGINFIEVDGGNAVNRVAALKGKQIDLVCLPYNVGKDYVTNGDFKTIGLIASDRNSFIPDVPTFKEQGMDVSYKKFFFFGFKKGTPQAIVDTFTSSIEQACAVSSYAQDLTKYGMKPIYLNPAQAVEFMQNQEDVYQEYVDMALTK